MSSRVYRPRLLTVVTWLVRVLCISILAGPITLLGVFTLLAHTITPDLKGWADWMVLWVLLDLINILGQCTLILPSLVSSHAAGKESKKELGMLYWTAPFQLWQWLIAAALCLIFPQYTTGLPKGVALWMQSHFPNLYTAFDGSLFLKRRVMTAVVPISWMCSSVPLGVFGRLLGSGRDGQGTSDREGETARGGQNETAVPLLSKEQGGYDENVGSVRKVDGEQVV
ncbi:hypothetical protein CALCODRAFT_503534 [Calocera cornea HHB12733]|uniref:Uncharacterized protein n=1 Tax=Calocera cornea HHB12733 TaxID=1353952 RepID=A0A165CUG6_9BASI|nr:hypothetical protein CALCODRAFT_503534 [Calocera cornea HHB12733]